MINTGNKCNAMKSIGRYNAGLVAEVSGPVTCFPDLRVKRINRQKDQLLMWEQGFEDVLIDKSEIVFLRVVGYNFPYIKGTNGVKYATYVDVLIDGTLNRLRIHSNLVSPEAKRSKKYFNGSIPIVSGWVRDPNQPKERDEHFLDPLCPTGYSPLIEEYVEGHISNPTPSFNSLGFKPSDIPPVDYLMANPYKFDSIELPSDFVFPEGVTYSPDKTVTFEYASNESSEKLKKEKKPINKKVLIPIISGALMLVIATTIVVPLVVQDMTGPASKYDYSDVTSLSGKAGIRIDKYIGDDLFFEVPNSIRGKTVVEIAENAFANTNISSVKVPLTVERIGKGAFYGCNSLNQLWIPFVGEYEDAPVNNYFSYIFGSNNWADSPNYLPRGMDSIVIHGDTSTIGDYAFANCNHINTIGLYSPITKIGSYAFKDTNINRVSLPQELQYLGEGAFYHSTITTISIPSGVKEILPSTFEGCENLGDLVFEPGLERIGSNAFSGCIQSKHLDLSSTVKIIEEQAFYNCGFLDVNLDANLTTIGASAFANCAYLWNFSYLDTTEKWSLVTKGESWAAGTKATTVTCLDGSVDI